MSDIAMNTFTPDHGKSADGQSYTIHTKALEGKLDDVVDNHVPERYRGTEADKQNMLVQGKRQELRRNFKLLTMTGFASMVLCAWEGLLPLFSFVLTDGGTPLLFWGFFCVGIGMLLVYASIAEIASMYAKVKFVTEEGIVC